MAAEPRTTQAWWRVVGAALFLLVIAALLFVPGVFWLASAARLEKLEDQLALDTHALMQRRIERPAHVSPALPGSFADHLDAVEYARILKIVAEVEKDKASAKHEWPPFLRGEKRSADLPPAMQKALGELRPLMAGVLAATHAGASEANLRFNRIGQCSYEWARPLITTAVYGTVEGWDWLAAGDLKAAGARCLDLLALARELMFNASNSRVSGAAMQARAVPLCAAVADRLSVTEKQTLAVRIVLLRDSAPSLKTSTEDARVLYPLNWLAGDFDDEHSRQLRQEIPCLESSLISEPMLDLVRPIAASASWSSVELGLRWEAEIADLPATERTVRLEQLKQRWAKEAPSLSSSFVSYRSFSSEKSWAGTERGVAEVGTLLAAIHVDVFRAEHGRWPASLEEIDTTDLRLPKGAGPRYEVKDGAAILTLPALTGAASVNSTILDEERRLVMHADE